MTHKLFTPAASLSAIAAVLTFATAPAQAQPGAAQPDTIAPPADTATAPAPVVVPPPIVSAPPVSVESIPPATAPQPNSTTTTPPLPGTLPPVTTPVPAPTANPAPRVVYEPSTPVVQSVPVTEASEPAEQAVPAAATTRAAPRTAAETAPRQTAPVQSSPATETSPAAPADPDALSPLNAPGFTGAANADLTPATPAGEAPADEAVATDSGLDEGVIIGGAAVLLLGAGGIAWAAMRNRRRPSRVTRAKPQVRPANAPAPAPLASVPVTASEPVHREEVSAVAATRAPDPVAPVTPAEVHARDTNVTVLVRPATRRTVAADSTLEAMVAAQPDAANPFLTRRNRLRRAKYLMEHGDYSPRPIGQQHAAQVAATQGAANPTASRSQPPVYDFGKGAGPQRRPGWKPVTST